MHDPPCTESQSHRGEATHSCTRSHGTAELVPLPLLWVASLLIERLHERIGKSVLYLPVDLRKAGQAYQRNPIDWYLVDGMHDHHMSECMQSYVCLVLISVRDKVMVAGVFHIRDKSRNL